MQENQLHQVGVQKTIGDSDAGRGFERLVMQKEWRHEQATTGKIKSKEEDRKGVAAPGLKSLWQWVQQRGAASGNEPQSKTASSRPES